MQTLDFYYYLPQQLIAQQPIHPRDSSKLLCYLNGNMSSHKFYDLPRLLREQYPKGPIILITNQSKVFPARIRLSVQGKEKGEVFFLNLNGKNGIYDVLIRGKYKINDFLIPFKNQEAKNIQLVSVHPPQVKIVGEKKLINILNEWGEPPLPPYIPRTSDALNNDWQSYQTVYATELGSCAAPTAGLHFTESLMEACKSQEIFFAPIVLHVGLGTFLPIKSDQIHDHHMHEEWYFIPQQTQFILQEAQKNKTPIFYVGTTSLRCIESYLEHSNFEPESTPSWHQTQLFIYPQHKHDIKKLKCGQGIITNFHQSESTLVVLISSLIGYEQWRKMYDWAIAQEFRF